MPRSKVFFLSSFSSLQIRRIPRVKDDFVKARCMNEGWVESQSYDGNNAYLWRSCTSAQEIHASRPSRTQLTSRNSGINYDTDEPIGDQMRWWRDTSNDELRGEGGQSLPPTSPLGAL